MYQFTPNTAVLRLSDRASIPADPANVDYQAYLSWVAAGNTPLPADPVPAPVQEISKLTIIRRLRALGKEVAFYAVLGASASAQADWNAAQSLRSDDPLFTTQAPVFKAALNLSDAEFASLLAP